MPAERRKDLLRAASQRITLPPNCDLTAKLAAKNLAHGLGKILFSIEQFSPGSDARFICSPDLTITRTAKRWRSGFAYGGAIQLVGLHTGIAFPDLRPNTCGMLVGYLDTDPCLKKVLKAVDRVKCESGQDDWDYSRRNHFINIYRSKLTENPVFIIHGCPAKLKRDTREGPGLNIDYSAYWRSKAKTLKTPLGPFRILLTQDAEAFLSNYRRCELLSKQERETIAIEVFGDHKKISNETHEGMLDLATYFQGCHLPETTSTHVPILTGPGGVAYLVTTKADAQESGILTPLPHGTGYSLPLPSTIKEFGVSGDGSIIFQFERGGSKEFYGNFSHVPYGYRKPSVVEEWSALGLFDIRDQLEPVAAIKI